MPLYRVDFDRAEALPVEVVSYAGAGIRERQNLQKLIANNLGCLGDDLFLVSESFKGLEGSLREVDILALDRDANLVVIELKRTDGGEYADLQAIRYAAMLSSLDFEAVVKIHAKASSKETGVAEQALRDFLGAGLETPIISDRPRIYLVAPTFEKELATTCLWLINARIDIRCIKAGLYKIGGAYHIEIEQELPQPSAQQYQYNLRDKQIQREEAARRSRARGNLTVPALDGAGILTVGMKVRMIKTPADTLTDAETTAVYLGRARRNFRWMEDNQPYSLSMITAKLYNKYQGADLDKPYAGPDYWAIDGESESLYARSVALSDAESTLVPDSSDDADIPAAVVTL